MTEDRDSRISDLYRQSSHETPPAHLDRAVMDMARKSVRRRVLSPFGNHWVAGGAVAGVVGLSVMLLLTEPQPPATVLPGQDVIAPPGDAVSEAARDIAKMLDAPLEPSSELAEKRQLPAAPQSRYRSFSELHDAEEVSPEHRAEPVARSASPVAPAPPVQALYLQAGLFREEQHADDLKTRITDLGFRCDIRQVTTRGTDVYHRVRVGPFAGHDALDKARRELHELGLETQDIVDPE